VNNIPSAIAAASPFAFDVLMQCKRRLLRGDERQQMLQAAVGKLPKQVRFLQMGANDGLINDPIREFAIWRHWHGTFVEPHPLAFHRLVRNYRWRTRISDSFEFVNAAVSIKGSKSLTLWTANDKALRRLPLSDRLSALRKVSSSHDQLITSFQGAGIPFESADIEQFEVPAYSVNELLGNFKCAPADFVVLDIEGLEPEVFAEWDFERFRPSLILFESLHMPESKMMVRQLLEGHGYDVHDLEIDTLATRII
jgi:FkbM family methyltransferase